MSFLFSGGLAESERAVQLSDVAPSLCLFWSSRRLEESEGLGLSAVCDCGIA